LTEAIRVVTALLGSEPFTLDGAHHRARDAQSLPPAIQLPHPRVLVGGKGDRLLGVIAKYADGWNTCWTWTTDAYRGRLDVLERACEKAGRDPSTVWRSLGLYSLCGENERDVERRFELMAEHAPPGVMKGVDLATFRNGRLVGTVDEVREQVAGWAALGVETLIAGMGAVPFHVSGRDDVDMLGHALTV
jgi:alkanesulfonate monooxygenase SsuD/methylene tetrahydromethanopterin reductase-like flavin-dependent oxidoreductase (luciferase family)